MSECIKLRLTNNDDIPEKWISIDGYAYLDLPEDFKFRETKQPTELTLGNKLKFNYILGFDLDFTLKNLALLDRFRLSSIIDNTYSRIPVQIIGGSKIFEGNDIYVKQSGTTFNIELRLQIDHWAKKSQLLKMNTLTQLGEFRITPTSIINQINEGFPYDENKLGIWFPFINYGSISHTKKYINIPPSYWRPWFYITDLLQKGFCELGYTFESDLFYSDYGRRLICYLINPDYGIDSNKVELLNASGEINSFYNLNPISIQSWDYGDGLYRIPFPDNVVDISTSVNNDCSLYKNTGEIDIKGDIKFICNDKNTRVKLILGRLLNKDNFSSGSHSQVFDIFKSIEFEAVNEKEVKHEWEFSASEISVTELDEIGLFMIVTRNGSDAINKIEISSGKIEYIGRRKYWSFGEVLNLSELIDPNIDFLTFIKGISNINNLKWYTDEVNKKILCLQPYNIELYDQIIDGFYIETDIYELYELQDLTSIKTISPELNDPRYIEFKFKTSTDNVITELDYVENLWSKTIDLGENYSNEATRSYSNVLFEPTLCKDYKGNFIPHIGDSIKHVWNIAPRVLLALGNVKQSGRKIIYYDEDILPPLGLLPTASHLCKVPIGSSHNDSNASLELPIESLVFDINEEEKTVNGIYTEFSEIKTLYNLMYRRWVIENLVHITLQYFIKISHEQFSSLSFRNFFLIEHLGRTVKARIDLVKDFHYCSDIYTPVNFIPEKQLSDLCYIQGTPGVIDSTCNNSPVLKVIDLLDGCYSLTIVGINNSVIDHVQFVVNIPSTGSNIVLTNTTPVSSIVCDIIETFEIQATVTYEDEDCQQLMTPVVIITPCSTEGFSITCRSVVDEDGEIHTAAYIDTTNSNYVINSFRWSDKLGPLFNWVDYIEGDDITGEGIRLFEAYIQIGNCEEFRITSKCENYRSGPRDVESGDCSDINLSLNCIPSEYNSECASFKLTGTVPVSLSNYDVNIKYSYSDDNISWSPWLPYIEGDEVCGTYLKAKAMIHFCDDVCKTICLNSICDECSDIFQAGDSSNIIFCNSGNV